MMRFAQKLAIAILLLLPASATAQEQIEYYGSDALGSTRVVFDVAGAVTARADYTPFGEEVLAPGPMPAQRFTGQARDGEAGLDYFHARMLLTRAGRFNNVDSVFAGSLDPQQWNRYAYVRNRPLVLTDPSGMVAGPAASCSQQKGAYWCPSGGLFIPSPDYVPSDNPADWGYHGGEVDLGEAQHGAAVDAAWDAGRQEQYFRDSAMAQFKLTVHATDGVSDTGRPSSRKRIPDGSDAQINQMAMEIQRQAGKIAEARTYVEWYTASAGIAAGGLACLAYCGPAYAGAQSSALYVMVRFPESTEAAKDLWLGIYGRGGQNVRQAAIYFTYSAYKLYRRYYPRTE
jgi:RHS repeat-associated protein